MALLHSRRLFTGGLVGAGLAAVVPEAGAAIVGSWIKEGGVWSNPVDPVRCKTLTAEAEKVR